VSWELIPHVASRSAEPPGARCRLPLASRTLWDPPHVGFGLGPPCLAAESLHDPSPSPPPLPLSLQIDVDKPLGLTLEDSTAELGGVVVKVRLREPRRRPPPQWHGAWLSRTLQGAPLHCAAGRQACPQHQQQSLTRRLCCNAAQSATGNAAKAGLKAGDTLIYASSFFGGRLAALAALAPAVPLPARAARGGGWGAPVPAEQSGAGPHWQAWPARPQARSSGPPTRPPSPSRPSRRRPPQWPSSTWVAAGACGLLACTGGGSGPPPPLHTRRALPPAGCSAARPLFATRRCRRASPAPAARAPQVKGANTSVNVKRLPKKDAPPRFGRKLTAKQLELASHICECAEGRAAPTGPQRLPAAPRLPACLPRLQAAAPRCETVGRQPAGALRDARGLRGADAAPPHGSQASTAATCTPTRASRRLPAAAVAAACSPAAPAALWRHAALAAADGLS
jgi:hypothetical protein